MQGGVRHGPEILLRAQAVELVFLDVDGTLTDGALYFTEHGETLKRFNVLDGYGLQLLRRADIEVAVISGRDSMAVRERVRSLGLSHAQFGVEDKLGAARSILDALGLSWSHAAAMGDDWPDLSLMRRCAFSAAPANAHEEVLRIVDYVSPKTGGEGAVRDVCDLLLAARGQYASLLGKAGA